MVYGDETGWREDGRNGYLWSFSTPKVRYFLHRSGRSRHVVEEALGDEFEGVLVSDFYGAYNVYQGPHQRCWTHLLRDIHQLKERFPEHDGLASGLGECGKYMTRPKPTQPRPGIAGNGAPVPEGVPRATMVHLPPYLGSDTTMCPAPARAIHLQPRAGADNNPAGACVRRWFSGGTRSTKSIMACSAPGVWKDATLTMHICPRLNRYGAP